ncbi:uncharacterized protein (DUF58 family) [Allocatelliglobosispora scoriae]|uniref:Uncharacterized protein (DUF58 family) n=1 Tax=Allocatelliglobosispora scoriae TaxID=643052 RepID=A0A841C5I3_9ACTN|nr:DUF58 domain-containing protein [Allocatelliglobosispora scoriae]MBB5874071.1 uncharacterized protein (DUF58 family) [Allocatelliglobosispora scoriae]
MSVMVDGVAVRLSFPAQVAAALRPLLRSTAVSRAREVLRMPTRLGWTVLTAVLVAGVAGWVFAWTELRVIALSGFFVVLLAIRYTLGKADLQVSVDVPAPWVSRGVEPGVEVQVRNIARRGLRQGALIEIPISVGRQRPEIGERPLGSLGAGATQVIPLTKQVPTGSRGVVTIGPVRTVRGDPLGLLRREMALAEPQELLVNPDTVVIGSLGAGLLKDLEGQSTNDRSVSDVSFHSLRDYVPGDDLRHVHAFTSARFGRPMVRQFVDTRTARLSIMVSGVRGEYASEQEFEDALSVGGSIAMRGVDDDQHVAVLAAGQHAPARPRQSRLLILDPFARAELGGGADVIASATRMHRLAPDTSIAIFITGGPVELMVLRRAANVFGPDVRALAIRVDETAEVDVARARRLLVVTVPSLAEFGKIGSVFGEAWS